ncbi:MULTISPECIES: hypothetical protein [unclassified Gilliamella]|uniref:hypothetical protein n=1 Tax=unclassified Gilliamella TaxID=2685620 RepID=UPI00080E5E0D|nr:hypothetical protein [Gilliamella apicola]OCG33662.1 hypothetical protein A9G32_11510 [Gilliamella apicola]OCG49047.1 hypothetical protein A9G26_09370 [Gilliamella apicola]OCG51795.1 hypothetical protein A9G27_11655 [Gilliamella apicola]
MLAEYVYVDDEPDVKQFENYLNSKNLFIERANENNLLAKAIDLLKMWGACNAYSSRCGYKNVSAMFSELYPKHNLVYIENELEFIDECMRNAKNSKDLALREQWELADLYYRGIDVVIDGSDGSERLTLREIAKMRDISKDTVDRRLKSFESYIVANLSKRNDIFY